MGNAMKAKLILEDGTEFLGTNFGANISEVTMGEVVFNTSMTGYQEILSDPSYCDQIICMTYPLIGNYGTNMDDFESLSPALKALIVKKSCKDPSNFRNLKSLDELLKSFNIPGIEDIDTRMLTKKIRDKGAMKGLLVPADKSYDDIKEYFKHDLSNDQISRVSCKKPTDYPADGPRVVLIDYGVKKNIIKSLLKRNCNVFVVPHDSSVDDIKKFNPDGVLLSNGPGDPKSAPQALEVIKELQNIYPLFCICMGHQLFALANGADTTKMKFGHRGANHPVKDLIRDRVYITSQNHGYAVAQESIDKSQLEITQINLNDNTVEGLKHKTLPAFSVQYHPEANPGPEDTAFLFDQFLANIKKHQKDDKHAR
jgi:carbamoyl-phosphate synthase small subunit